MMAVKTPLKPSILVGYTYSINIFFPYQKNDKDMTSLLQDKSFSLNECSSY